MGFLQSGFGIRTLTLLEASQGATKGPDFGKAALNTVLGMGTVFIVLIFISFLISAFKIFPAIEKKRAMKKAANAPVVTSIENVISQITEQEEENLADDLELVAVITAAIMASMGAEAPADGLVVRSIRRKTR